MRTHNYNMRVKLYTTQTISTAYVLRPDGKTYMFTDMSSVWTPDGDIKDRLEKLTDGGGQLTGWRYTTSDDAVELYDDEGRLLSIADVRGNSHTLTYDGGNRLSRIDASEGNYIQFAYNSDDKIESLTDSASRSWGFRYDANDNLAGC